MAILFDCLSRDASSILAYTANILNMKFLLQSEFKNEAFITLQRAQDFHQWKNNDKLPFEIVFTEDVQEENYEHIELHAKDYCPVGSVEFVHNYYKEHFGINLKPINVPWQLFPFAGRMIGNYRPRMKCICGGQVNKLDQVFVKLNDIEKWEGNGIYNPSNFLNELPDGYYQESEIIDIHSEYRCFVYQGQLLGIHFYQGDFWKYPDRYTINKIIDSYKDCPTAYTLDVAVAYTENQPVTNQTVVLEVHDFYACGLYGFQDLEKLPFMYWRSHLDKINTLV